MERMMSNLGSRVTNKQIVRRLSAGKPAFIRAKEAFDKFAEACAKINLECIVNNGKK